MATYEELRTSLERLAAVYQRDIRDAQTRDSSGYHASLMKIKREKAERQAQLVRVLLLAIAGKAGEIDQPISINRSIDDVARELGVQDSTVSGYIRVISKYSRVGYTFENHR